MIVATLGFAGAALAQLLLGFLGRERFGMQDNLDAGFALEIMGELLNSRH